MEDKMQFIRLNKSLILQKQSVFSCLIRDKRPPAPYLFNDSKDLKKGDSVQSLSEKNEK
jgi:hypothetical protein